MCSTDAREGVKRRWLPVPIPIVDEEEEVDSPVINWLRVLISCCWDSLLPVV
jgi:hypothetical protein